jgi:hypothetical protein
MRDAINKEENRKSMQKTQSSQMSCLQIAFREWRRYLFGTDKNPITAKLSAEQYLIDARIHFPAVCKIRVLTTSKSNQYNYYVLN